ncbi:MAG: type I methionyl aminopeptidase, partial [Cyanobacteria bacterium J06553_1]
MNFLTNLLPKISFPPALNVKAGKRIELKSASEIETMRAASRIVATVLKEISEITEAGMTTADLDDHAEKRIREMGATPSFK